MAFLFKSKKNAERALEKQNSGPGSQASLQNSNGRNVVKEKDAAPVVQNITPASSVNNSLNSLGGGGGTVTPSPEQANGRRGPSSEQQLSDLPVSFLDA
jgi:hypothetical protein